MKNYNQFSSEIVLGISKPKRYSVAFLKNPYSLYLRFNNKQKTIFKRSGNSIGRTYNKIHNSLKFSNEFHLKILGVYLIFMEVCTIRSFRILEDFCSAFQYLIQSPLHNIFINNIATGIGINSLPNKPFVDIAVDQPNQESIYFSSDKSGSMSYNTHPTPKFTKSYS